MNGRMVVVVLDTEEARLLDPTTNDVLATVTILGIDACLGELACYTLRGFVRTPGPAFRD